MSEKVVVCIYHDRTWYEDGTYQIRGRVEPSKWKIEDNKLMYSHPWMRDYSRWGNEDSEALIIKTILDELEKRYLLGQ